MSSPAVTGSCYPQLVNNFVFQVIPDIAKNGKDLLSYLYEKCKLQSTFDFFFYFQNRVA